MTELLPVVSIITVVLNRVGDIRFTLESIVHQTYPNIEYIIVDGGSTDGTLAILKDYSDRIAVFISEKDRGIYDAMNKGLHRATGKYVLYINGGDALHTHDVIDKMMKQHCSNQENPDILYGECMFVDRERKYLGTRSQLRKNPLPEQLTHESFLNGSNVTHQCFIVQRNICSEYNLKYKLSSDVDWMLNCIKRANKIVNVSMIISDFVLGDASQKQFLLSLKERFLIMKSHYGLYHTMKGHFQMLIR